MIQCKDCEFYKQDAQGNGHFTCDPFSTVKEPECLAKWQLIKTNMMVQAYHATLSYYHKLAPMQEKMFKVVQRELDEMNEGDQWKYSADEDDSEGPADEWNRP